MKIDYVVVSADDSDYLNYWPAVRLAWARMGVRPVLLHIGEGLRLTHERCTEIYIKPIPGISSPLQAQIARIWAFRMLEGNILLSDIDMMPLSRDYFVNNAEPYTEDQIVSYSGDGVEHFKAYHPMCYILASSKVIRPLIEHATWEEFVRDLAKRGGEGWFTDQWHMTSLMERHGNIVSLKRGWGENGVAHNRLDRRVWDYTKQDVMAGKYFDAHLPRPYNRYAESINYLLSLVGGKA